MNRTPMKQSQLLRNTVETNAKLVKIVVKTLTALIFTGIS